MESAECADGLTYDIKSADGRRLWAFMATLDYVSYFILGLAALSMLSSICLRFYFHFIEIRALALERAGFIYD